MSGLMRELAPGAVIVDVMEYFVKNFEGKMHLTQSHRRRLPDLAEDDGYGGQQSRLRSGLLYVWFMPNSEPHVDIVFAFRKIGWLSLTFRTRSRHKLYLQYHFL
jgi:hypothetical protein